MLDRAFVYRVYWFLFASGYLTSVVLMIKSHDNRANYRFTTCGSSDREGPTYMECIEHYCNSESPVCGHLLNEGTRGSQIFVVPRSGNYTVTIAGASGGHGVCSNYSGLGVIVRETVQFRRGEKLRILVGQQGISACDGHQDIDACQISNDIEACEDLWNTTYRSEQSGLLYLLDGGGSGGGASLLETADASESDTLIVIAPGGGGAGAIYNTSSLSIIYNISDDDPDTLYRNHTYGHAFEIFSDDANGTAGKQKFTQSAGAGAGYFATFLIHDVDARPLVSEGFGGSDCDVTFDHDIPFPDTHGGFGGGGGGCNGGGGGGGYTGGSIFANEAAIPGEGGYSWPDPPWPLIEYNDGDGYVELFLESCGCTYNYCIIYNQSSFECTCPSDTLLALNGFDCYTEETYYIENEEDSVKFPHSNYGTVTADIVYLNSTLFTYSIAVLFNNDSSSSSCAVLFVDNKGNLRATTKFINKLSDRIQYLELFTASTNMVNTSAMISVSLSMNNKLMLEEPLPIASVITFGIDGDCILEELIVNISIDNIFEFESDAVFNLSSTEVLYAFLDSFTNIPTSDSPDGLSAGAIAGIVVSVITILVIVIIAVSIYFCKHSNKYKFNFMQFIKDKEKPAKTTEDFDGSCIADNNQYEKFSHEYEKLSHEYESVLDTEMTPRKKSSIALRYGYKAPLQDYYKFNCSRRNKLNDWSYDRAQLIYMREIGEGYFGKVLLMKAKNICGVQGSVLVAVKTLTSRDPKDIQKFSEEMDLMKKFIHPNIVSLLGHCEATSDGAPMMILELMQYGDLKWFLKSNRPSEENISVITDSVAIDIVTDVATALEYLAANKFVHRDVAARNCLIGEGFKAKLSDFGLTRGVHEKDYYKIAQKTALPVRWMAPESLLYGKFSSASDVWSFGVLVWEVATYGKTPYNKLEAKDIIEMAGNDTLKLDSPVGCLGILTSIVNQCTRIQSEDRPTFTEILECCDKKNLPNIVKQSSKSKS